jgi:hypothetical protein
MKDLVFCREVRIKTIIISVFKKNAKLNLSFVFYDVEAQFKIDYCFKYFLVNFINITNSSSFPIDSVADVTKY